MQQVLKAGRSMIFCARPIQVCHRSRQFRCLKMRYLLLLVVLQFFSSQLLDNVLCSSDIFSSAIPRVKMVIQSTAWISTANLPLIIHPWEITLSRSTSPSLVLQTSSSCNVIEVIARYFVSIHLSSLLLFRDHCHECVHQEPNALSLLFCWFWRLFTDSMVSSVFILHSGLVNCVFMRKCLF